MNHSLFRPRATVAGRLGAATLLTAALLGGQAAQAQTAQTAQATQVALVGEDYRKVNQLITTKNYAAALQEADSYLANNPRDPQMRLLRSRVLVAQGKTDEARNQLLTITQEYPEIAEPYNNLAVLYAQAGELDLARTALESAVRINPGYAVALHNLGDVYRRMAHEHYSKALALQPGNRTLQEKAQAMRAAR
ncbi:MAG: tetratricopeptide repeat protein [Brachymonas sp.]|nr:tetratricopeptide repeat protein [Brachymonas sp.]